MSARPRLRLWVCVGSAAVAAGALGLALILTSNHPGNRVVNAVLDPLVGWSFALSGLVAWSRRPSNGTGRLLVLVSFAWFAALIGDANNAVVYTIGQMFGSLMLAVFAHLMLAYPEGRLRSRLERILVGSGYGLAAVANTALLLVYPHPGCPTDNVTCPRNVFLVSANHTAQTVLIAAVDAAAAVLLLAMVLVLLRHWRRSSPAKKRFLRQIYLAGVAALLVLAAGFAAEPFSGGLHQVLVTVGLLAFATLPFLFLAGVLQGRLARGGVAELLVGVRESATPVEVQDGLRRVLRDPELQLAVWQPERGGYADVRGRPFELAPEESAGRVATLVTSEEGSRLAAFVHDPALLEEPELLEGVVAAGRLALHRDRLQAELQARLVELERERDFVRDVVNAAPAFFVVIDLEGRLVRFNDTLVRASGIADDERVRGQSCPEVFVSPADRAEVGRLIAEAAPGPHEHRWLGVGGELVVEWSLRPIADVAGRPRLLLTGLDVSQRVHHEAELRESRARIVEAGDAERRRLERNLHDGAQQRLVSVSLALRLARSKLLGEPERADALLEGASGELALALEELRELARGIHPAVLTDRGLGPALESLAESSTVPVELDVPGGRLPPAVEAAAFYVVSESLANVAKYAHASGVRVAMTTADGRLDVVVADDGIGGADPERGSGLRGLVDRVEALGGRLELASPPGGGTRVHAALPLGVHEPVAQ